MWETVDQEGRPVHLRLARWLHIVERHPDLGVSPDDILEREGKIVITLPERRIEATDLGDALVAALVSAVLE